MITMAKRNIRLFFRDKAQVFFSLLSVFIIILLFALFIGDSYVSNFNGAPGAENLMNSWVVSGILAVISITSTLAAFGIMVEDKSKKISKDFYCAPVKRWQIAGGYIISAFVIGLIMSVFSLVLGQAYMVSTGAQMLAIGDIVKLCGVILLAVMSSSSMMLLLVSFFKSQNAFGTASTLVGTLIGFLVGMYVPMGSLPQGAQMIMKLFPTSHAGALFRQIIMREPMAVTMAGAPPEFVAEINHELGVLFQFGGTDLSFMASVIYLIASTIICFGLSVFIMSKKSK